MTIKGFAVCNIAWLLLFLVTPLFVFADNDPFNTADIGFYQPSVDIPGVTTVDGLIGLSAYINVIYGVAVVMGALLAVVMLVLAGVQYAASDVVTNKGGAIERIQGALVGLLIILSTYLILQTINPSLNNIAFFDEPLLTIENPINIIDEIPITFPSDLSGFVLVNGDGVRIMQSRLQIVNQGTTMPVREYERLQRLFAETCRAPYTLETPNRCAPPPESECGSVGNCPAAAVGSVSGTRDANPTQEGGSIVDQIGG